MAGLPTRRFRAGKPPIDFGDDVEPAPAESPFGDTPDQDQDQQTALLMVRAMIAAASADGVVDNAERSHIVGSLEKAGLDVAAAKFLDEEFAKLLGDPAAGGQLGSSTGERQLSI